MHRVGVLTLRSSGWPPATAYLISLGSMFYTDDFMWEVLNIRSLPTSLYHYTSIDTLEAILKTRSLKFTRLDKVNDPEEANALDIEKAASLVFVSCWSAQARESIMMWKMYGGNARGVRIAMPHNPFLGRDRPKVFEKGGAQQIISARLEITRSNGGEKMTTSCISGPNKIYYTDDPKFREVKCLEEEMGEITLQLHDLGMVKNSYWAQEEEWRYKVLATMQEAKIFAKPELDSLGLNLSKSPVKQNSLFVPIDKSTFGEIEVVLGPLATSDDECRVRGILAALAPKVTLTRSAINMRATA